MRSSGPHHQQVVDSVSAALSGDAMVDSSGSDEFSNGDDDEMSEDDEVDDLMTLDQFQADVRRESLIRKGTHVGASTLKKEGWNRMVPMPDFCFLFPFFREIFLLSFIQFIMIALNILCWNCRGISARETSSRVLHIIKRHKSSLVCLVETRADNARLDCFCASIPRSWNWAVIIADGF